MAVSAGGALDGYAYAELDGNIRIAVPTDWTAGEVGTVALEWAPKDGSQRLVAYVEASYDSAPPPFGTVNFVKFEVPELIMDKYNADPEKHVFQVQSAAILI